MYGKLSLSLFVLAQILGPMGVSVRDEGSVQGPAYAINCTGSGLACSVSAGVATFDAAAGGSGAPTTAQYWVGAADAGLSAEKDLGALGTGLVVNTAGVPTAYAGTSCTGSFPRSLNASGAATCADVDLAAGTDVTGVLTSTNGGTGVAPSDDRLLIGVSGGGWSATLVPDCDLESQTLNYDTTLNTFTCLTDGGGGPTTLTSTTLQSDAVIATYTAITGLSFTPAASTNYLIDCFIIYTSTVTTTGINFAWDVPAAVNSIHMTGYTTTTALGAIQGFIQRADNVGTPTSAAIVTTEQVAVLQAKLRNGANATTTSLGFTPETANSVSVLAGSICQYRTY